jgi:EAL domain-containing protein (putative c-di-GMP-specific phosphodiesterase class I)
MDLTARLLGLAFASADALLELDAGGVVRFAAGAGALPGEDAARVWTKTPLDSFVLEPAALRQRLAELSPGKRSSSMPITVRCADGRVREAQLRAFILPQLAPAVSCALSWSGAPRPLEAEPEQALLSPQDFLAHASRALVDARDARDGLALVFVDVRGLPEGEGPPPQPVVRAMQTCAYGGSGAAQLTDERFAFLRAEDETGDPNQLIQDAARAAGLELETDATIAPIPPGSEPLCALRAMRFAIEGCLKDGGLEHPGVAFTHALRRTLQDADRFRNMVRARDFALHYQPIVDLETRAVHHFEALARFGPGGSPAAAIRLAEELALVESFDLAVVEKAVGQMRQPGHGLVKIAVNLSAASLETDAYVAAVLGMTSASPADRRRLIVEVTETAALADIEAADRRLAALRRAGIQVCIDDFGAGAATFDYLRRLSVDAVKIDGGFVRDAAQDPRSRQLIGGLVELCASLNLTTIAEMIETEEVAETMGALGVHFGQGWLFGRPEPQPRVAASPVAARRKGVVEAWG